MTQNAEINAKKQAYVLGIAPGVRFRDFVAQQRAAFFADELALHNVVVQPMRLPICSFHIEDSHFAELKMQLLDWARYAHAQHVYCDTFKVNAFKGTVMLLPTLHSRSYLKDIFFHTQKLIRARCQLLTAEVEPHFPIAEGLSKSQSEALSLLLKRVDIDFFCDNLSLYPLAAHDADPQVLRFDFGNQKQPTGQLELF
mgnify:CR=1 FL=1